MDPNAIISAEESAVGPLAPALGIGGIGMAGAAGGAIATRMATCQAPLCRVGILHSLYISSDNYNLRLVTSDVALSL